MLPPEAASERPSRSPRFGRPPQQAGAGRLDAARRASGSDRPPRLCVWPPRLRASGSARRAAGGGGGRRQGRRRARAGRREQGWHGHDAGSQVGRRRAEAAVWRAQGHPAGGRARARRAAAGRRFLAPEPVRGRQGARPATAARGGCDGGGGGGGPAVSALKRQLLQHTVLTFSPPCPSRGAGPRDAQGQHPGAAQDGAPEDGRRRACSCGRRPPAEGRAGVRTGARAARRQG
jgi:hypothetical protein